MEISLCLKMTLFWVVIAFYCLVIGGDTGMYISVLFSMMWACTDVIVEAIEKK